MSTTLIDTSVTSSSARVRLLIAATEVFAAKGHAASWVSDCVGQSGVSQGSFYLYFKCKQALFEHLIDPFCYHSVLDNPAKYVSSALGFGKEAAFMEHVSGLPGQTIQHEWRVHLCTTTEDQTGDEAAVREWLRQCGCTLLVQASEPKEVGIEVKIAAARTCDLCILLLGARFGPCDSLSSFSHTELEVSAASDIHPNKVLIFRRPEAENTTSPEQHEFVERVGSFYQGTFQRTYQSSAELRAALDEALKSWQPPQPHTIQLPRAVRPGSVMISSTGDLPMRQARAIVHSALLEQGLPVIDYLDEPSESVTPLDRVVSWARDCRALVILLNGRYGSVSPLDGLGITELEFVTALRAGHPILALIGPAAHTTDDEDQRQFVERVQRFLPVEHVLPYDDTTLDSQVRIGLARLLHDDVPNRSAAVSEKDQVRWYRRQVQRWLGVLPHLLQPQGMPLEQVYVSLAVAPPSSKGIIEEGGDEKGNATTLDADEALMRFPRMLLQGNPGAGKTVALRWFAVSADSEAIPIYIRLGAYAQAIERRDVSSLEDYIRHEERRLLLTTQDDQEVWLPLLREGRGVVLLDALDEVSSRQLNPESAPAASDTESLRYRVTRDILAFAHKLPTTPMVVASRSSDSAAHQLAPTFTALQIQPLNSTQRIQVVLQWLHTAHPDEPLEAVQKAQRVLDIIEGGQDHLRAWAATPLMLTLLIAIIDSGGSSSKVESLSRTALLRRAIRLLLGQWGTLATRSEDALIGTRRLGGKLLWPKEQLLVHLAWNTFFGGRRQIIGESEVQTAWQALPQLAQVMGDESSILSELSGQDGFLPQAGEGQYSFYHPIFQEYLAATWMARFETESESEDREHLIARKRLDAGWEEATQLLVGELDRLHRPDAADKVVRILIDADRELLSGLAWADPTHLALRRAARVQGNRTADVRGNGTGAALSDAWRRILQRRLDSREDYGIVWTQSRALLTTCQAFLDMGEAAATAAPLFRDIASDVVRQSSSEDPFDRTPDPLVRLIEALGSSGTSSDVLLLASLLEPEQGIGDAQAAALRGLLRLGPNAVRPFRDRLPRFVYAGGSSLRSMTGECGELAASLLIHMEPTREELEGIGRLGGRWQQEAHWAAPLLPLTSDAIDILHKTIVDGSGHIRGFYDERSALDYRDDTKADDRFVALAASSRLGLDRLPLLPIVLFRAMYDTPRNRRLAESIVCSLGTAAVPAIWADVEKLIGDPEVRELHFGHILTGLETSNDPKQIRSLISQAIGALREIRKIQDQQHRTWLMTERVAGRTPQLREDIKSLSLDQQLATLRSASANENPAIRQTIITQVLDSIAHMGSAAAPALEDVCRLTKEQQYRPQSFAVLAGLGEAAAPALPLLREALSDPDVLVQTHAIEAIGQLGEAAFSSLPVLRSLLSQGKNVGPGTELRQQIVVAWGRLWPLTRPYLTDILEVVQMDPDMELRITGVDTLGQVAEAEPRVLDALYALSQTAASHFAWDTRLPEHARAALEQILARTEDAEALSGASSSVVEGPAPQRRHRGLLGRLGGLFFGQSTARSGERS